MKKTTEREGVVRSTSIDVIQPPSAIKRAIIDDIRRYRFACNKAAAACYFSEIAGAEIVTTPDKKGNEQVRIKPNSDKAKRILSDAFGVVGKAHLYELRLWLRSMRPSWMSIVPEAIHHEVSKVWTSKDPEYSNAKRGWLQLQGARKLSRFANVGIYLKNTVPKLRDRSISVKWDMEIGEVELKIGRIDGSRWNIYRCLRDNEPGWKLGAMWLTDTRSGDIKLIVSYTMPSVPKSVDNSKEMLVEFGTTPENYITMHTEKEFDGNIISVAGAVSWASQVEAVRGKLNADLGSYGSRGERWFKKGRKAVVVRSERLTERRTNGEKDHNHYWTRRIVDHAQRTGCGKIVVVDLPEKTLFDLPWSWYDFAQKLKYKIEEVGGSVEYTECVQELRAAV